VPLGANSLAYNSLWQLRNDAWSSLEESTAQLALAFSQQRPVEQLTETVTESLNLLGPIERFWAFPGPRAFQKVRRLFLDTPEIHGYRAECGYRVYVDKALEIAATARPAPPRDGPDPALASPAPDAP